MLIPQSGEPSSRKGHSSAQFDNMHNVRFPPQSRRLSRARSHLKRVIRRRGRQQSSRAPTRNAYRAMDEGRPERRSVGHGQEAGRDRQGSSPAPALRPAAEPALLAGARSGSPSPARGSRLIRVTVRGRGEGEGPASSPPSPR